ncbi:MAG TPA: hypothetical protein VN950_00215 [Terriglobales bacterium]|nr:hypothetical protein [Terriglobales bacterium]
MIAHRKLSVLALMSALASQPLAFSQKFSGVLTWHNDNARTGLNSQEATLTPANVKTQTFGKLFSRPVQGQIYAQPLYVPNVSIPGEGKHNVVYVATEHDQLYAFDADGLVSQALWQDSFIDPAHGITTVSTQGSPCKSLLPEVGITSTPVIDGTSDTLYVVVETDENGTVVQRLHALDIASGAEKFNGPVVIQASVNGVVFDARQIQRAALLLENGSVYLAFASLCVPRPYHGWLLEYSAQNLQTPPEVFLTTPGGVKGGIWQSGAGLASDGNSIYFGDGDGTFDADKGGVNYGMSLLRLTTQGGLAVADYFSPYNERLLSKQDLDLGSGGVLLLPKQAGKHPYELVEADKTGSIFVVDRLHMGGFNSKTNNVVQTVQGSLNGYWSTAAYCRQNIYYSGVDDHLSMYSVSDGLLSTKPVSTAPTEFRYPGCTPSISANGTSNGIVWAIESFVLTEGGPPAVLHAYDATDVSKELYNSKQNAKRDTSGVQQKYSVPTIANGKVYVGTQTELDVYGLLQ